MHIEAFGKSFSAIFIFHAKTFLMEHCRLEKEHAKFYAIKNTANLALSLR
jgi:hypothetical protein